ncbi:MAG: hypothetical protein GY946_18035, partial [bacterium]|nr:hypothetical protein [bacterium]
LTYFDFSGSRGEECRLALQIAGVDFEDHRIKGSNWAEHRPHTPFGSLPVLEIEGLGELSQSNAILAYIGRAHGLHPTDPWSAARHEALMCAAEDLRSRVFPTLRIEDEGEKKTAREEMANGLLQDWGRNVEQQLGEGPFVAGDQIHVADIKLYMLVRWFARGLVDYVPSDVFGEFPRLLRLHDAVENHPRVVEWYAS